MVLDRIVVGVGSGSDSERLAAWAQGEFGPVCQVSRVPLPDPPSEHAWGGLWTGWRGASSAAAHAADHLASAAFSAGADLVVVGQVPEEMAERLVRVSPVPVLLAGDAALRPVRRVLAAVDRAPSSERVLTWAREVRDRLRGVVVPCHVIEELSYTQLRHAAFRALAGQDDATARAEERRAWLRALLRAEGLGEAEPLARLPQGDPATEIVAAARACGADLVVVGSRSPEGAMGSTDGAIRRALVTGAAAPVLVAARAHWAPRAPSAAHAPGTEPTLVPA